jgi:hypothetical protein
MEDHEHRAYVRAEAKRQEQERKRRALADRAGRERTTNHAQDLERDVRFLTLMNRALLEVVIDAGLIDLEEFVETLQGLDEELDGVAGDGLTPAAVAEELGVERSRADKTSLWKRANRKGRSRSAIARIRNRFAD